MVPNELSARVALSFKEGCVGIYNLVQKQLDFVTSGSHTETIFDCAFSTTNADIFATSSFDSSIKLWDISKMKCIDSLVGEGVIYALAWHPTKKFIAGAFGNGAICIWDAQKRAITMKSTTFHKSSVYKIAWNPLNPNLLASGSKDHTCVVFNEEGKTVKIYRHAHTVFGVEWSPFDKSILATGCHDFIVRVYDISLTTDACRYILRGHTAEVFNVKWHPTIPGILMTGSNDHTVRVWNTETGDSLVLTGHTNNVRALAWSYELSHIALTGSWDGKLLFVYYIDFIGTIRVWDCHTSTCIATVNDHHSDVYGLSSHPNRPFLYGSTSRDTTIRFFTLESTFKEIFIKAVMRKSLTELIGNPYNFFQKTGDAVTLKLSGVGSKFINTQLQNLKSDVERYALLFDFLSQPYDTKELWNVASSCALGSEFIPKKSKILHSAQLTSTLELKARDLESVKYKKFTGVGTGRKVTYSCNKILID
jgi:WD40 repeat protein